MNLKRGLKKEWVGFVSRVKKQAKPAGFCFVYLTKKCLLCDYYVPGTMLAAEGRGKGLKSEIADLFNKLQV